MDLYNGTQGFLERGAIIITRTLSVNWKSEDLPKEDEYATNSGTLAWRIKRSQYYANEKRLPANNLRK